MRINNLASINHGAGTLFMTGATLAAVFFAPDPVLVLIGVFCLVGSWSIGGIARTAVICRTFHSPAVERFLTARALAPIAHSLKVIVLENDKLPDLERRYDVGALRGLLAAAVSMIVYWNWAGKPLAHAVLLAIVSLILADRAYFVLLRPALLSRSRIYNRDRVQRFVNELTRPSWSMPARYVRHIPCLRHCIKAADDCWFEVIITSMYLADFVVIDLTDVQTSPSLLRELRATLQLMHQGKVAAEKIMYVCDYSVAADVYRYLDSEVGPGSVRPLAMGSPGQEDSDFLQFWARAGAA